MQDPACPEAPPHPPPWAVLLRTVFASLVAVGAGLGISQFLPEGDYGGEGPVRLLVLFTVPSSIMAGFAILFASRAPEGARRRLGIVRPELPPFVLWLIVPATWAMWLLAVPLGLLGMWLFDAKPEDLSFAKHLGDLPPHWSVVLVIAGAVFPAVGEELLFRGHLQSGLLRWWRPVFSLGLTASLFALAHWPPVRVLAILPLAAWLGFVAFRSRSILPGIGCHILQNLCGLSIATSGTPPPLPVIVAVGAAFLVGVGCFATVIVLLVRARSAPVPAPGFGAARPSP